jgi:hypothetical protein
MGKVSLSRMELKATEDGSCVMCVNGVVTWGLGLLRPVRDVEHETATTVTER